MPSSKSAAWAAVVCGTVAIVVVPAVAYAAERKLVSVDLVRATIAAVVASLVFGLVGVSAVRRARFRLALSLTRSGERTVRLGRLLVFLGLYVALIGSIALGFYGVVLAFS